MICGVLTCRNREEDFQQARSRLDFIVNIEVNRSEFRSTLLYDTGRDAIEIACLVVIKIRDDARNHGKNMFKILSTGSSVGGKIRQKYSR